MNTVRNITCTPREHDFFDEVTTLFVNLGSFNATTESFHNSASTLIPNSPDHTLNLFGRFVHISFPIHSLLHGIVRNNWPHSVQFQVHSSPQRPTGIPNGIELQNEGVSKMVTQLVGAMFLKFYERNAARAKLAYPTGPKTWPEVWRFAWLLRNAIAHGDKWNISDPNFPSTTWHGITVDQSASGCNWYDLNMYIGGGDVILLMEEINSIRP